MGNAHVITWGSSHFSSSDRSIETLHVSGNDIVLEQSTNPNGSTELSPSQFLVNHVAQSQHGVHDGAVDSVTRTMAPPTTKRKRKAPTLRSDAWTPIKARIYELHVAQNTPLSEVKDIVEKEYEAIGFSATIRQYRTRVSQWGWDKNVKRGEMSAIVRKRQHRKVFETGKGKLKFRIRGNEVPVEKIDRWMCRNGVPEDQAYVPSSTADTPEALSAWTGSDRGSHAASPASTQYGHESPIANAASPVSSISTGLRPKRSSFTGQSPTLGYRSVVSPQHAGGQEWLVDRRTAMARWAPSAVEEEVRAREELASREAFLGREHEGTLGALQQLAEIILRQGRYRAGEEAFRLFLARCRKHYDDEHSMTLEALDGLGRVFAYQGLYEKAERQHRRVLDSRKRALGLEHPGTLRSMHNLAIALRQRSKYEEAEVMLRQTVELQTKVIGLEHLDTLTSIGNLMIVLMLRDAEEHAQLEERAATARQV